VGVPLAGYGGGERRQWVPNLNPSSYAHFLKPSTGIRDPIYARALYVSDGTTPVMIVALDAIATTNEIVMAAWAKARALGSTIDLQNLMVCASHTHSGPGCVTNLMLWELLAVDLYNDKIFQDYTDGVARAILEAEQNAVPVRMGASSGYLPQCTHNRRAGVSPVFTSDSVDPEVIILRVDDLAGNAIATLWNFAIHGISLDMPSHVFSADIMGGVNAELESRNLGVALFLNSGEGDISPNFWDDSGIKQGGPIMADGIAASRAQTSTVASLDIQSTTEMIDMGAPALDITVQRIGQQLPSAISQSGVFAFLQQVGITSFGVPIPIPAGWCEREFRFQAIRLGKWGFCSIPGEAIHTITTDLKNQGAVLGYDKLFTCGLANGHMMYVTTEQEYDAGGYEGLCTLFGRDASDKLEAAVSRQITRIKP
jgi:hypothetical protein